MFQFFKHTCVLILFVRLIFCNFTLLLLYIVFLLIPPKLIQFNLQNPTISIQLTTTTYVYVCFE